MNFRKLTDNEVFITDRDRDLLNVLSADYKYISVGMECDFIESCRKWPFRPGNVIFGEPHDLNWLTDSSRIKDLLSTLNIVGYYGHNYMQIELPSIFTKCIYKYIDGEWHYYLHPSIIEKVSVEYGI